jgi:hypothetical protein
MGGGGVDGGSGNWNENIGGFETWNVKRIDPTYMSRLCHTCQP